MTRNESGDLRIPGFLIVTVHIHGPLPRLGTAHIHGPLPRSGAVNTHGLMMMGVA